MISRKVKGMYDILPTESYKWQYLEEKIRDITKKYNYLEIRTPNLEYSEVFHRESELSDMVTKETYNFKDKGNRDVTLKPEGTAGVIRSYVENKLYASNDLFKSYYIGTMYRYERPQKGRFREFRQFGLEVVGSKNPLVDAEVISFSNEFIKSLGLNNVEVLVNSIGDSESRENYLNALLAYLDPFKDELSNDSKERLVNNPLRILDSKAEVDINILKDAPKPFNYLSEESKKYLENTLKYLDAFNVSYSLDDKLVRGLDYYSEIVFEIKADIKGFGPANILGGGGRYEQLVSELGGPKTSAFGIAFGMERLLLALENENLIPKVNNDLDAFIITFNDTNQLYLAKVLNSLRENDFKVDLDFETRSFKSQLKKALNNNSKFLIILGENEVANNLITIKNTKTEHQETIKLDELINKLKEELEG